MCRLRCLDPFSLYPTSLFIFVDYILYIQLNINLITKYTKKIKKNMYRWPKQRARLGLFSLSCLRSLSLSCFSQFTTYVYNKTLVINSINKYEENIYKKETYIWPKQHVCCCLGLFSESSSSPSFFPPVAYFVVYNLYIQLLNISQYEKKRENIKKHVPMAQTTPDVSFGPVFVVTAFHHSCRVFCRVQTICMLVSTKKKCYI